MRLLSVSSAVAGSAVVLASAPAVAEAREVAVDPGQWRVVERESGPDDYYSVVREPGLAYVRARYRPPMKTAVIGWQLPDAARSSARTLRWRWRAEAFPRGGNECGDKSKADSAAVVYVTWRRALKWYTLKYVWSSVGPLGWTCDRKRSPFTAQDTVILESGGALDQWKDEEIDLRAEFRRHFEGGSADAEVPDLGGIGLMSDGDQTGSDSAADYAGFTVVY